jgi:hypothetical protein
MQRLVVKLTAHQRLSIYLIVSRTSAPRVIARPDPIVVKGLLINSVRVQKIVFGIGSVRTPLQPARPCWKHVYTYEQDVSCLAILRLRFICGHTPVHCVFLW